MSLNLGLKKQQSIIKNLYIAGKEQHNRIEMVLIIIEQNFET
jgi:hypothetical protein